MRKSESAGLPNPRGKSLLPRHSYGWRDGWTSRLRQSHRWKRENPRRPHHRTRNFKPHTGNRQTIFDHGICGCFLRVPVGKCLATSPMITKSIANHLSYLEPISGSLQKPIEGLPSLLKKIEDRSRIDEKHNQKHVENHFAAINKTAQRHPENPNYRNATNAAFQKS